MSWTRSFCVLVFLLVICLPYESAFGRAGGGGGFSGGGGGFSGGGGGSAEAGGFGGGGGYSGGGRGGPQFRRARPSHPDCIVPAPGVDLSRFCTLARQTDILGKKAEKG